MEPLDRPRVAVDFNELVEEDCVLLSRSPQVTDSAGAVLELREGVTVFIYQVDANEDGELEYIVATGKVERNRSSQAWHARVPWLCRIEEWGRIGGP